MHPISSPVSSMPSVQFPAMPPDEAATLQALQWQFDQSEFWTPAALQAAQFQQITALVEHAMRTVPFHAKRLRAAGFRPGKPVDATLWRRLPIMTRADLRDQGEKLHASQLPAAFGGHFTASSSGSTGVPVRVRKSDIDALMWNAISLRELGWHDTDASCMHVAIKGFAGAQFSTADIAALRSPSGLILPNWGRPASVVWKTGPSGMLHSNLSDQEKIAFLIRVQPAYLSTSPSTLRLLLGYLRDHGIRLPSLRAVHTSTERLDDDLRDLCMDILHCKIIHNYSANEVGYMALQCPMTGYYHVQSEVVHCEVLNDAGAPCAVGEIGRVVVTPLHNFAMPLLRYQIGDEAEIGPMCPCGRGLPVLKNIIGRTSDYLTLPSGMRRRLTYNVYRMSTIESIKEYQLVQTHPDRIEIRMVVRRELTAAETGVIEDVMHTAFDGLLRVSIRSVTTLPRTAAGKLRPFISEIEGTSPPGITQ